MNLEIEMKCSVCGNDQFSIIDDNVDELMDASDETKIKCSDCGRIISKEQLIEENNYNINANIEDIKDEIVDKLKKDFGKMFK